MHSGTVHESDKDTSSFGYTFATDCLDPEIGELVSKGLFFFHVVNELTLIDFLRRIGI